MELIDRAIESAEARLNKMRYNLLASTGNDATIQKHQRQIDVAAITVDALHEKQEMDNARSEGRLVILPVKIGDTVYCADFDYTYACTPSAFYADVTEIPFEISMLPEIGKTYFLTYDDADKVLKMKVDKFMETEGDEDIDDNEIREKLGITFEDINKRLNIFGNNAN